MSWSETLPLLLTAAMAAVPVALPATFALATRLGARSLAKLGVLSTRLSPVDEAAMVVLVFGGEATLYAVRERRRWWSSRPGTWVVVASLVDVLIISALAVRGIEMHSLPLAVVASTLAAALLFAFLLDQVKVPVFRRLGI